MSKRSGEKVPQTPEEQAKNIANEIHEGAIEGAARMTIEEALEMERLIRVARLKIEKQEEEDAEAKCD